MRAGSARVSGRARAHNNLWHLFQTFGSLSLARIQSDGSTRTACVLLRRIKQCAALRVYFISSEYISLTGWQRAMNKTQPHNPPKAAFRVYVPERKRECRAGKMEPEAWHHSNYLPGARWLARVPISWRSNTSFACVWRDTTAKNFPDVSEPWMAQSTLASAMN